MIANLKSPCAPFFKGGSTMGQGRYAIQEKIREIIN